jgi:vitamin B12 transporter
MQFTTQASFSVLLLSLSPLLHAESLEKTESSETTLSPITVTATRTEKETNLVSSTVIKRKDIERLQVNTLEEALRGIAGVDIANNGGTGKTTSIYMRGTNSDHVLVLIDGIRIGSVTLGSTAFENIPINEVDSIEVVRGAKSSLYGSEAIGGVIHIHTRSGANNKFKPVASVSAGTHNHFRYSAGVSGTVEKTWYNLNLTQERTQGFDATRGGLTPDHDGWNNHSGTFRVGHNFSDRLLVEFNMLYSAGKNLFDYSPDPVWGGGDQFATSNYTNEVYGGQIKYKATDFWNVTIKTGNSRDFNKDRSIYASVYDNSRFSLSLQNDFKLAQNHLLSVGYDYLSDSVKSTVEFSQTQRDNHAAYAQYQGEYGGHQVNLGIRFDNNQQFGDHVTWNAAYGYHFLDAFNIIASYSTAFKAPTFNQLYDPWVGNKNLAPERANNYEVGINGKHDWGKWGVNFYQNDIKNLIIFDPSNFWRASQVSAARIQGIDATLSTQLYGFNLQGNLSLLSPENRVENGSVLINRAQQIFRLDVDKKISDFNVGASLRSEGHRFSGSNNTNRVSGFTTLDLRAEYTLLKQLTLQAKVNNILNKQYQTVKGYNTDDLNFFFTLRYTPDI